MPLKIIRAVLIVLVLVFILAQFVRPDFTNPPVVEADTLWSSPEVPADVKQIIRRSCADCHSNETKYPWYAKITPSNWFLADHINEGRHELNFSEWNTYKPDRKVRKLGELCEQVESGAMPLPSYLWLHGNATLSESDKTVLCDWAKGYAGQLGGGNEPAK